MDVVSPLITKDAADKILEVKSLLEAYSIESITITTDEEAEGALGTVVPLKQAKKDLLADQKEQMGPHYAKYIDIRDCYNGFINKIDMVTKAFDNAYKGYVQKKEALRIAENMRLAKIAAEQQRIIDEQVKAAEAKAQEYADAGRLDLAAKWDTKASEKAQLEVVVPVAAPSYVANVRGGFNTRKNYKARITNIKNILVYFHKNGVPPEVQDAIQKYLDGQARASKGVKSTIQGSEFYTV